MSRSLSFPRAVPGTLIALSIVACGDLDRSTDSVNDPPVAEAGGPYAGTVGASIDFDGTGSSDPEDASPLRYGWSFGDGETGAGATPAHAYAEAGTYTATLVVTDTGDVQSQPDEAVVHVSDPASGVVLVGAGDIADCGSEGDEATAALLDGIPGTIFTTGDNAYPDGRPEDFAECYDPSWGRHKDRTRPSPGNHDYETSGAEGYFDYFGAAAGDPGRGYYSYELGDWHVVVLNSEENVGEDSQQVQWLRGDLAASSALCTVAYWHHPRFSSSSRHGNEEFVQPLWDVLYDHGVEIVLGGHDHTYERFGPQTPHGEADPATGIRQFVVGTGGRGEYPFGSPEPNSEVRYNDGPGVLKLTLGATGYSWEFIPVSGSFEDSGAGTCH
jgi:PKD repeat protein